MVRGSARLVDVQQLAYFLHEIGLKLASLVSMQLFRNGKSAEKFLHWFICNSSSLLIWYGVRLSPPSKIVRYDQGVRIAIRSSWEGSSYINCHHLHWVACDYSLKGALHFLVGLILAPQSGQFLHHIRTSSVYVQANKIVLEGGLAFLLLANARQELHCVSAAVYRIGSLLVQRFVDGYVRQCFHIVCAPRCSIKPTGPIVEPTQRTLRVSP